MPYAGSLVASAIESDLDLQAEIEKRFQRLDFLVKTHQARLLRRTLVGWRALTHRDGSSSNNAPKRRRIQVA